MGYLTKLNQFFDSIQDSSARKLSCDTLVQSYLQYMSEQYGHDEAYYRARFTENAKGYSDFEKYIYYCIMGLTKCLRKEYELVEKEAKKRVKLYSERVHDLHVKVDSIDKNEKYKRDKYKFFLEVNNVLLERADSVKESSQKPSYSEITKRF